MDGGVAALRKERSGHLPADSAAPSEVSGWVNTHGIALSLLDTGGRVVRQYQTTLWDNDQVLRDVRRLLAER